jgi:hypothetical protein
VLLFQEQGVEEEEDKPLLVEQVDLVVLPA